MTCTRLMLADASGLLRGLQALCAHAGVRWALAHARCGNRPSASGISSMQRLAAWAARLR